MSHAVRCSLPPLVVGCPGSHFPYCLAVDGIVDYADSDWAGECFVQMSCGEQPVLVCSTVAELDERIAAIAVCQLPPSAGS